MKRTHKTIRPAAFLLGASLFLATPSLFSQQVDIPEPTFMQIPAPALYQPQFKGADPFRPWEMMERNRAISILELDYHGILSMGGMPMAFFTWRGNPGARYTLKSRKLLDGNGKVVEGVVGDITAKEVVLVQGNQRIPYPREQRRP